MKLTRNFKSIFYLFFTSLYLTGVSWWCFEKFVHVKGAFGEDHHPYQQLILRIHGAIAYFTLLVVGYLIHSHIRPGLKSRKKRSLKTGWMMIIVTGSLIASSAMDLFGPEGLTHDFLVGLHWYLGLAFPLFLGTHLFKIKSPV